ncbi:hypothetical protein MSAN_02346600 [Mycena sanguinolenta]|uniref:Uncharacterized protein n=1 Tax=Mycena sanguinolenta TaxID=230812 RepID=A0A8H6X6C4_9AGAR|nr:hypothetical protein MSAN_02346600 [Mycena sanguinolenta]
MPATAEVTGPSYISSHSADVILSDIRPIKLKLEGLRSINVLLDEFLFNILNTSRSLSTDKLRQSLLTVLPTSIGKEALLEAEVELRAYWDRTPRPAVLEDDTQTFNLQWAFELLRLKCEAYSTLNETDEDSSAVTRLQEKMTQLGGTTPPVPALVAPASLYLTAILESMCEHILSNVGRVAARDSSRTGATVQDVFVALCEDHSIYALFKSMRVYQQIEQLAQTPKPRRSKSFSRSDRPSISQNSASSNQDQSSGRDSSSQHRSRGSTDTTTTAATTMPATASTSRTSFDKARKKLLSSNRNSSDGDSQSGHKRSDSLIGGDETKHPPVSYEAPPEDTAMLKEFDNLMRSDSTMKVSLTPDRLKTMEVYKSEKERAGRRPPALALGKGDQPDSQPTPPSRANGRRPSLRQESIVEDEEEIPSKSAPTPRKTNITSPPNLPSSSTTSVSSSSNSSVPRVAPRKSSRSNLPPSSQTPPMPSATPRRGPSGPVGFDPNSGFPAKTRRIQKNREDMDIDDIMAGSDDDDEPTPPPTSAPRTPSKAPPVTPNKRTASSPAVSASTRELMDFLAEGPPDVPKLSASGRDMVDFLAQGPPDQGGPPNVGEQNGKKGSGRLQRMMSKLSMGTSERSRSQPSDDFGRGNGNNNRSMPPTTPVRTTAPGLPHQTSYGNLANRPVPPRMPLGPPISPPSSPSEEDYGNVSTRSRKESVGQSPQSRRVMPTWEQQMTDGQTPPAVPGKTEQNGVGNGNGSVNGSVNGNGHVRPNGNGYAPNGTPDEQSASRSRRPSAASEPVKRPLPKPMLQTGGPQASPTSPRRSAAPTPSPVRAPAPPIAEDHARDMRRLLAKATNADECRLLFEMFLAKAGVAIEPASYDVPYPSPSSSDTHAALSTATAPTQPPRDPAEIALELSLVELFLGGGEPEPAPRKRRTKKKSEPTPTASAPTSPSTPLAPTPAPGAELHAPEPRKYTGALVTPETSTASSRVHTPTTVPEVGA